jgi:large subunit ribosomal protein L18
MATGPRYIVKYRRRRKADTDYKRRLNLLKSRKPRLVVRKTSKHTLAQVVDYTAAGDKVIVQAHSKELVKYGWGYATSNIPSAYLVGLLAGVKAKKAGVKEGVVDLGRSSLVKGGVVYAVLKGALDGGLSFPVDEGVFPSEARLRGEHIASHNKKAANIVSDFAKTKDLLLKSI